MANKINPWLIIRDHHRTLYDARGEDSYAVSKADMLLFYGFPLVLAAALVCLRWSIPLALTSLFVNVTAIFIALLLNLIVLVDSQRPKGEGADPDRIIVFDETTKNIAFAVFVSIAILISTFLYSFLGQPSVNVECGFSVIYWLTVSVSAVVAALALNLVLTLLMVLKRFHLIVTRG